MKGKMSNGYPRYWEISQGVQKKKKKNEFPTDIAGMPNEVLSETILIP